MRFKIFYLTLVDIFNKQFINIKNMDYLSHGTVCNMNTFHIFINSGQKILKLSHCFAQTRQECSRI